MVKHYNGFQNGSGRVLAERENYIRNATFNHPKWIPVHIHINDATWDILRYDLEDVVARYPVFFPNFKKGWRDYDNYNFGPAFTKDKPFTDSWGCTWVSSTNGIEGVVVNAPLDDWSKCDNYLFPDPLTQGDRSVRDWNEERKCIEEARDRGELITGYLPHGFLFMRLQYLRGFENSMMDFALKDERLGKLIQRINQYNKLVVQKYLNIGVDVVELPEDLGTQTSTVISPANFNKWIIPAYKELIDLCKSKNTLVAMHSDGYIIDIIDDIINAGVDIINPQDLCNGVDQLERRVKGKACIRLDIDRQKTLPFGSKKEIFELIEEEVRKLGQPAGGLEFIAGIYPPTSPDNVNSLCEALEKYRRYWWD